MNCEKLCMLLIHFIQFLFKSSIISQETKSEAGFSIKFEVGGW